MRNIFYIIFASLFMVSCTPRVDLDEGQWEQTAKISEFVIYRQIQKVITLPDGTKIDGVLKEDLAKASEFDNESRKVIVIIPAMVTDEDLSQASCYLTHNGIKVVPLDNSPKPGTVLDWSSIRTCKYRIETANPDYAADWTIIIERE